MFRFTSFLSCFFLFSSLSAQTDIVGTIQSGGLTREYLLYEPAIYNGSTPVPLVINMHGYTSNNIAQALYGNFRNIADTANFIIVLPNGTLDNQGQRFWNAFGVNSDVDDVGFIRDLIDSLSASYNIDPQRIYATGMSNGGFMSYVLACELNDRIAAIASVTGSMAPLELASCNPVRPVPVMEIHGTADDVVPYNGSPLLAVSIPDVIDAWVEFNHCNATPLVTNVPNTSTTDGCTAVHYLYSGGENGSTVEHYKIVDGGHTWPGAGFIIGVTNQDVNASKEIWRFFSQYNLNGATTATAAPAQVPGWTATPNPAGDFLLLQPAAEQPVDRIQVWGAAGQLRAEYMPANTGAVRVETATWPPGLYFISIEQNGKRECLKVLKS